MPPTGRAAAMIDYIKKATGCRSQHIANYFTDVKIPVCSICDNCINEKGIIITKTEFENIVEEIKKLTELPVSSNLLLKNLNMFKKEKVWKVLNYLHAENKISITENGLVSKRKRI